jgi:low affinity Fe/Cu permease
MINIVGFLTTKLGKTVGIALAVVVILFLTTKSIQNGATDSLLKDIKIEQVRDDFRTTERTTNAIDEVRRATPDADAARQWLLDRQQ